MECVFFFSPTNSRSFKEYQTNALLRSGVERQLEIVGEAAKRILRHLRVRILKSHGVRSSLSETSLCTSMATFSMWKYGT